MIFLFTAFSDKRQFFPEKTSEKKTSWFQGYYYRGGGGGASRILIKTHFYLYSHTEAGPNYPVLYLKYNYVILKITNLLDCKYFLYPL